jgi:microcompartment protein CcmK/EutM
MVEHLPSKNKTLCSILSTVKKKKKDKKDMIITEKSENEDNLNEGKEVSCISIGAEC